MKMNKFLSILVLGLSSHSFADTEADMEPPPVQKHIDKAYALAGDTFIRNLVDLQCSPDGLDFDIFSDTTVPPATKVFDNLYYVGITPTAAWALQTSDGIILIDALNTSEEGRDVIEAGLLSLGLNPSTIKYIVVTHGHGDHYGGARYLVEKYGTRVLMSEADWELAANPPSLPDGVPAPNWPQAPDKDMVAFDGQELILGDTTLRIVATPGHTSGTISVVFPVFDGGKPHMAGLWGGTGYPQNLAGLEQYIDSVQKFLHIQKNNDVDVMLSNHPFVDDSIARITELRENPAVNPFVIGERLAKHYTSVLSTCARASIARIELAE